VRPRGFGVIAATPAPRQRASRGFASRPGAIEEDDGYLVTFVTNLSAGTGECAIFDARDITPGPIARVILPQQVPTRPHAFWAPEQLLGG